MIKVTVDEQPIKQTYPYIGVGQDTGAVVFFTAKSRGVCLDKGDGNYTVGKEYGSYQEGSFQRVKSVTIYND